ncbi:MAG TPA: hypothetical protein PLE30_04910 [Candidatus Kapabacteria bacterium]|nr:hypothetical protein [Candidatus Kapabacteria bacterium]
MNEISPLFALEAEQLLLSGFIEEAIELCNKGLEVYPNYPVAQVILAKSYQVLGDKISSDKIISQAKNDNYGKVFDTFKYEDNIEIINNNSDNAIINSTIPEDIPSEELSNTEVHQNALLQNNETNEEYLLENSSQNNLLDTNINISDGTTLKDSEIREEIDDLLKDILFVTEDKNINKVEQAPLVTPISITNENKVVVKQVEYSNENTKLTPNNSSFNVLSKNKDYFFQQFDALDRFDEIEQQISNSIKDNPKKNAKKLPIQETLNISSSRSVVMGLISTRYINNVRNGGKHEEIKSDTINLPIYTETMAKIFVAQGNKEQAKNIYAAIIEREPEKAEYFRDELRKLSE